MHAIESGNFAAATGVKLARVQVIAAYPITPQTPLTEKLSEYVASGELDSQYIPVESEHSALSVCIAAASTGARAFTATSSNGLLYMSEQVHWAAGARLPVVMCVVNRGIGAPGPFGMTSKTPCLKETMVGYNFMQTIINRSSIQLLRLFILPKMSASRSWFAMMVICSHIPICPLRYPIRRRSMIFCHLSAPITICILTTPQT